MEQLETGERGVCQHGPVALINPYEQLRKYECQDCQAVLTCSCDREIAVHVLPHQAMRSVDAQRFEVRVTDPLVDGVCHECRGRTPPPAPRKPHRGAASPIHRYYWREIYKETNRRFIQWLREQGMPLHGPDGQSAVMTLAREHADQYTALERIVIEGIKERHASNPMYDFARPSDADVLAACGAPVEDYPACYLTPTIGHVEVLPVDTNDVTSAVSVEEFVARRLRSTGREVMLCESRPFHALYATLMWPWVQDPADSRSRVSGFGRRTPAEDGSSDLIWTMLPEDFGSPAHPLRRSASLQAHLDRLPATTDELLWVFDYWTPCAEDLKQYLWAHEEADAERARRLIEILGPEQAKAILSFLADDYWGRYLGWPDLVTWRNSGHTSTDIRFVEVKSSNDRLSEDQRDWMTSNSRILKLPFTIAKVHKTQVLNRH